MKASKKQKTCPAGHVFYKTSDCPTCPVCEKELKPVAGFLAMLSAPARRALQANGITTIEELAKRSEKEILQLHGVGPASLPIIRSELKKAGFKP